MWILLALGFLIPFVYIGYLLSKLDKFLEETGAVIEDRKKSPVAIVLGSTDLAKQVGELLEKNRIRVFHLTEPFLLEREQNFRYMFALSENDADNIVLCKIGKEVYSIEKIISLCNDPRNEGMFLGERIRYLSVQGVTAHMLYQAVAQDTEVTM
jgi:hypothetical protein